VKRICPFCGFSNASSAAACAQCAAGLEGAKTDRTGWFKALWILPPILALAFLAQRNSAYVAPVFPEPTMDRAATTFLSNVLSSNLARISETDVLSGKAAAAKHADEWARRRAHDPAFANSLVEDTILRLERIGKDQQLAGDEALRRVAEMVLPRGSRVEVSKLENGKFKVRAAFRISAFTPADATGATAHKTVADLRADIEDATARVVKDLFEYCGSRGIESISVSCNSVVSIQAKDAVGKEETDWRHRSLYRATVEGAAVSAVANWRDLSLAAVKRLIKIERDLTPTLILSKDSQNRRVKLDEPLEF
jgi:hypothetical protein